MSEAARRSVIRILRWYQREPGDAFVGEVILSEARLHELQELFCRPDEDPMFDCYPVTPSQVATLQALVTHQIDLARYDYFVEAESPT